MEKINYLSQKLNAFTFDEIFILAEMSKGELTKNLKQLVKEGTLKETSQGYVFVAKNDNKLGFKPTTPNKVRFVRNDEYIKFKPKAPDKDVFKPKNIAPAKFSEIPDYNKRTYEKYMNLLKLTNGMHGKQLQDFIVEYNKQNPLDPTSYQTIIRKSKNYRKRGDSALLCKYGKTKGSVYKDFDKYFRVFKRLYLSPKFLSYQQCRDKISSTFKVPLEEVPSIMCFRRWLLKEMTSDEIREKRSLICF